MDRPLPAREIVAAIALAVVSAIALSAIAVIPHDSTNDFDWSALQSLQHLQRLEIAAFLDSSSIEAGSYILRAPLAFLPKLWGGGSDSLFAVMTVPGAAALVAFGVALWHRSRLGGGHAGVALLVLLLVVANPFAVSALVPGHAEEIVGAVLCVAGVVAAGRGRTILAAVLVGLAVANKAWAVVAILPVLVLLRDRRLVALAVMAAIPAIVLLPLLLRGADGMDGVLAAAETETMFKPWQIWWFLADPDNVHFDRMETTALLYRDAPAWVARINHPLAVMVPAAVCLAFARRMRARPWHDMLLLLALMLLLRCMLDAANNAYYHVPFLFCLLAWEVLSDRRVPWLTVTVTAVGWPMLVLLPHAISADAQAALYLATSVPLTLVLAARLIRSGTSEARRDVAPPLGDAGMGRSAQVARSASEQQMGRIASGGQGRSRARLRLPTEQAEPARTSTGDRSGAGLGAVSANHLPGGPIS